VLRRTSPKKFVFSNFDRWVLVGLYRLVPRTDALAIVRPETVICWRRAGFRLFWRWKSRRRGGRRGVPLETTRGAEEYAAADFGMRFKRAGTSTCDGWRDPQRLMDAPEIIEHEMQRHSVRMIFDLLGERIRYPNRLSGGQQQRVAIARALSMPTTTRLSIWSCFTCSHSASSTIRKPGTE
jgi:hypothetical protein